MALTLTVRVSSCSLCPLHMQEVKVFCVSGEWAKVEVPRRPERSIKSCFLVPVGVDLAAARQCALAPHAAPSAPSVSAPTARSAPSAPSAPSGSQRFTGDFWRAPAASAPSPPATSTGGGASNRKRRAQEEGLGAGADRSGIGASVSSVGVSVSSVPERAQAMIDLTDSPPPSPRAVAARRVLRRAASKAVRAPAETVISLCSSDEES